MFKFTCYFWLLGSLKTKAREKGLLNISTFFSNPLLCLKQDDFQMTHTDERKGTKDYMKVSLVLKNHFLFCDIDHDTILANFCY